MGSQRGGLRTLSLVPNTNRPRSPYYLFKNVLKKSRERQEAKELQLALEAYRRKSKAFLKHANTAVPRIQDCNGDFRHQKDFTVKPRPDGTFLAPPRCRPKRWQGSLMRIGELEAPNFDEPLLFWEVQEEEEPDVICV